MTIPIKSRRVLTAKLGATWCVVAAASGRRSLLLKTGGGDAAATAQKMVFLTQKSASKPDPSRNLFY
ncbi:MAG: hypothetical protein ACRETL_00100, partial [Gammaproteobacteria bacterium]